jgi:autotransporter-associated beta strand protein
VILATANTYTGPTNVQAGILQIGDGISGSVVGTSISIAAGATVELNQFGDFTVPTSGDGTLKTVGDLGFNLGPGILTGNLALNVAGSTFQVVGVNNQGSYDGPITVTSGTLRALGTQALGTATGSTTILNGGTLDVNAFDLGGDHVFVTGTGVDGNGAIVNNGGGTVFNLHRVTLTGPTSFGGTGRGTSGKQGFRASCWISLGSN